MHEYKARFARNSMLLLGFWVIFQQFEQLKTQCIFQMEGKKLLGWK